jgi:hypothetical protein
MRVSSSIDLTGSALGTGIGRGLGSGIGRHGRISHTIGTITPWASAEIAVNNPANIRQNKPVAFSNLIIFSSD